MNRPAFALALAALSASCVAPYQARHPERALKGGHVEEGYASWYGMNAKGKVFEHGKLTASGTRYDQNALTAAHKTLPLGTRVTVTNLENGRRIMVVINDRGPYIEGRIIDLTLRGARALGFADRGTAHVRIEALR
jgi:rare lipoprotein A